MMMRAGSAKPIAGDSKITSPIANHRNKEPPMILPRQFNQVSCISPPLAPAMQLSVESGVSAMFVIVFAPIWIPAFAGPDFRIIAAVSAGPGTPGALISRN